MLALFLPKLKLNLEQGGGNVKKSFKKVLKKVKKKVSTFEEKGEFNSLSFIFPRNTTNFL